MKIWDSVYIYVTGFQYATYYVRCSFQSSSYSVFILQAAKYELPDIKLPIKNKEVIWTLWLFIKNELNQVSESPFIEKIYRQSSVRTSSIYIFILINKVPHHKVGNFIRAKVPSCSKRKLGRVKNNKYTHPLGLGRIAWKREREEMENDKWFSLNWSQTAP